MSFHTSSTDSGHTVFAVGGPDSTQSGSRPVQKADVQRFGERRAAGTFNIAARLAARPFHPKLLHAARRRSRAPGSRPTPRHHGNALRAVGPAPARSPVERPENG